MNNALEITEKKVVNILARWVFWGWKWGLRSHVLKSACNDLGMLLWKRCLLNLALKVEGKKVDICIWITDSLCFIQFSSVTQSYSTLCNLMDCSMPGLPVHHQLLELSQTHVHRVSNVIKPSHPLKSSSPPAFSLSQHQGLFQWVSSSHQVSKVLELQLHHESFQWIFRVDFL